MRAGVSRRPAPPALPAVLRAPLGAVAVPAALVLAALSVLYAAGGSLGGFDGRAQPKGGPQAPLLLDLALVVDFAGEPLGAAGLLATLVAVCLLLRRWRTAVLAMAGAGAAVAATRVLKPVVGRLIHGEYLSFPSGHTAVVTAMAMVAALLAADLLRTGPLAGSVLVLGVAATAGAAIAWAQVVLSAHYPTDTVGGFCTALVVVPATGWLVDRATAPLWPASPATAAVSAPQESLAPPAASAGE